MLLLSSSTHGCASGSSSPSLSRKLISAVQTHNPKLVPFCNRDVKFHLATLSISSPFSTSATRRGTESDGNDRISSLDYLIRSFDLSPEVIDKISKRKQFQISSISRADSVLALFREYGFTTSQISTIFVANHLLKYSAPALRLKLDFFAQNGVAGDALLRNIAADANVLRASLERRIAPCFDFLADFFGNRQVIFALLSIRNGHKFVRRFRSCVPQNARSLRLRGVPASNVVMLMVLSNRTVELSRDTDAFEAALGELERIGFRRSSTMFIHGIYAMLRTSREKWVLVVELFKRFGCSEKEFLALFLKQPTLRTQTEKSLEKKLIFLFDKVGWTYLDLSRYPAVLTYSFEQRILPRFAILELLLSRGLVKKISLGRAFQSSEAYFMNRFIDKYRETLPHLLEVYQSNFR